LAAQRERASARFTFKMAVFWFADHFLPTARSAVGLGITFSTFTPSIVTFGHLAILPFFNNYWPQKLICLTKFLLNPNSSNINAIGVWHCLVQKQET
jgi:hypothetical protein